MARLATFLLCFLSVSLCCAVSIRSAADFLQAVHNVKREDAEELEERVKLPTLTSTTKHARSCELHHGGRDIHLSCPKGYSLKIKQANYGRTQLGVCPTGPNRRVSCKLDVTDLVRGICQNEQDCVVAPSNKLAGDPCRGTPKYLDITYECTRVQHARSCELHHGGEAIHLSCDNDYSLKIQGASYGRTQLGVCPTGPNRATSCNVDVTDLVKRYCENRQNCVVTPSNRLAGDPCSGTPKYLDISYDCTPTTTVRSCEHGGSDLHLSCSKGRKIIVYEASYGHTEAGVCPGGEGEEVLDCNQDVTDQVKGMCPRSDADCTLAPPSNKVFGDPCPGVEKYLTVKYFCL